jgi:hypothetical protein
MRAFDSERLADLSIQRKQSRHSFHLRRTDRLVQGGIEASVLRRSVTVARTDAGQPSVEEVLVELLDVDHFFDPTANVEANHQPGKQEPIDQYDALAQHVGRFFC